MIDTHFAHRLENNRGRWAKGDSEKQKNVDNHAFFFFTNRYTQIRPRH